MQLLHGHRNIAWSTKLFHGHETCRVKKLLHERCGHPALANLGISCPDCKSCGQGNTEGRMIVEGICKKRSKVHEDCVEVACLPNQE